MAEYGRLFESTVRLQYRIPRRREVEPGRLVVLGLGDLGIDLVRIVGRVSNNFCTAFLGQVFSLSGKNDRYPALDELPGGGPPFHPQCSKSTAPYVEELASETQQEVSAGLDDARKLLGMTLSQAQKAYQDLQLRQQVEPWYGRLMPIKGRKISIPAPSAPATGADARRQLEQIETQAESEILTRERSITLMNNELDRLNEEWQRATAGPTPNIPLATRIQDVVQRKLDRIQAIRKEIKKLREDRDVQVRRAIAVDKPVAVNLGIDAAIRGDHRRLIERGADEFAKMVAVSDVATLEVKAHALPRGQRAYAAGNGIHIAPDDSPRVVIHELGHALEDASPSVHREALAFLARRTRGEMAQSLRQITGNSFYDAHERARPDKFIDPYMGKDYGSAATEIVSMGLEYMWANTVDFARRDPDYFDFIFNLMRK